MAFDEIEDTPKRKPLSKKTRFEVFKRDAFACQYCGAHPPSAVLECDHIIPVAEGGKNDIDNLITACFDCNRGKGAISLSVAPQSLSDKAALVAEREEQLRGYSQILEARRQRLDDETWRVLEIMDPKVATVPRDQFNSARMFIEKLGVHEVLDAMEIAMASTASYRNTFKYFCGVCWNKIRKMEAGE
jgi:hypothetical protein